MLFFWNRSSDNWFESDKKFNRLYPRAIRELARKHWTPLWIAQKAASFLAAESGAKILDIGSGCGKFCLAAAHYNPAAQYYGVEQRENMVNYAEAARNKIGLQNVKFIHGNFTHLDFTQYNHFYFYNSFYENIAIAEMIDHTIDYSGELYNYYNRCLYQLLDEKPPGTKLATFHSLEHEIPKSYQVKTVAADNLLKFWIKQ